jgi:hypothetical protein
MRFCCTTIRPSPSVVFTSFGSRPTRWMSVLYDELRRTGSVSAVARGDVNGVTPCGDDADTPNVEHVRVKLPPR